MLLGFGVLVLFVGQGSVSPLSAQSNACPPIAEGQPPRIDIIVDQVELHGNPLSNSDTAALVEGIEQTHFTASSTTDDEWANEIMEVPIRGTLQDNGYFNALIEGTPYLIHAVGDGLHVGLRVEIESGPQYRSGDVRLVNVREDQPLALSEAILRQQIEWNAGDLFSVAKIRRALKSMTNLYGSKGFIDMTPEPEFRIHDENSRIDLIIKIDEGPRYRIAEVAVFGLEGAGKQLQLPQSAGDYFSSDLWRTFFGEIQSRFRHEVTLESAMTVSRNTRDSTVRLALDFAACPQSTLPAADRPHLATRADR